MTSSRTNLPRITQGYRSRWVNIASHDVLLLVPNLYNADSLATRMLIFPSTYAFPVIIKKEKISQASIGSLTATSSPQVVYAGQLTDGTSQVDPSVEGVGRDGPLELKVSRRHTSAPTPPNPDLQRIWAYLAVQVRVSASLQRILNTPGT